jgi:hypothetical protein
MSIKADTRLDFYRELASRAKGLSAPQSPLDKPKLEYFRDRILTDPDRIRRMVLGANALRLRQFTQRQRDMLEVLECSPDLLGPIGLMRYEPSHTLVLGYLMTPERGFPLSTQLLRAFLELVNVDDGILDELDLTKAVAKPEYFLPNGRVDICITIPHKDGGDYLVFTEVKVDAQEGDQQLERYDLDLQNCSSPRGSKLVYLTRSPQEATSFKGIDVEPVEFRELLQRWLPVVAMRGRDHTCAFGSAYLKTLALLTTCAADGRFDQWSFALQRSALDLIEESEEE